MGFLNSLFGSNPADELLSVDETRQLMYDQQRMNNPNISNYYGSSQTTFGPDGQANITQSYSPQMQQLAEMQTNMMLQGAPQYQRQANPYAQSMMNGFGQRIGERAGFPVASANAGGQSYTKPSISANETNPSYSDMTPSQPIVNNPSLPPERRLPPEKPKYDIKERLGSAGAVLGSANPLAEALLQIGMRRRKETGDVTTKY